MIEMKANKLNQAHDHLFTVLRELIFIKIKWQTRSMHLGLSAACLLFKAAQTNPTLYVQLHWSVYIILLWAIHVNIEFGQPCRMIMNTKFQTFQRKNKSTRNAVLSLYIFVYSAGSFIEGKAIQAASIAEVFRFHRVQKPR